MNFITRNCFGEYKTYFSPFSEVFFFFNPESTIYYGILLSRNNFKSFTFA